MAEKSLAQRLAPVLFFGSLLAMAGVFIKGVDKAKALKNQPETLPSAAAAPDREAFDRWVDEGDIAAGKGRLIGQIEHNGRMVEVREMPESAEAPRSGSGEFHPPEDLPPAPLQ